jgi:hypothetical protein
MQSNQESFKTKLHAAIPESEKLATTITTQEFVEFAPFSPFSPTSMHLEDEEPIYSFFRQPRLWWKQNYLSWRFYTTIYAALALLVTFIVFVAMMAAMAVHGVDANGRITLYTGSCASIKWSSFFAKAFLSALGTYMLSASSYVMVSILSKSTWPD